MPVALLLSFRIGILHNPAVSSDGTFQPGTLLADKYRVDRLLGQGGMGAVYLAENTDIGRKVAIKVLKPELAQDPQSLARFKQEARSAASIGHPGIVEVLDLGMLPDGGAYIVMELLEGETLRERLQKQGTLSPIEAVTIIAAVLDTLAVAHDKGVIHRDIKPENLFLVDRPLPGIKVLDFGISKLTGAQDMGLTRTGTVMGTPLYMSPEQARGAKDVGPTTDIYSIGAILYEAMSGQPPFPGESYNEVLAKVLTEAQRPLNQLRSDVPAPLATLIESMLNKVPGWRPQNARAAALALRQSVGSTTEPLTEPGKISPYALTAQLPQNPFPLTHPTNSGLSSTSSSNPNPSMGTNPGAISGAGASQSNPLVGGGTLIPVVIPAQQTGGAGSTQNPIPLQTPSPVSTSSSNLPSGAGSTSTPDPIQSLPTMIKSTPSDTLLAGVATNTPNTTGTTGTSGTNNPSSTGTGNANASSGASSVDATNANVTQPPIRKPAPTPGNRPSSSSGMMVVVILGGLGLVAVAGAAGAWKMGWLGGAGPLPGSSASGLPPVTTSGPKAGATGGGGTAGSGVVVTPGSNGGHAPGKPMCEAQRCVVFAATSTDLYQVDPAQPDKVQHLCAFGGAITPQTQINDIAVAKNGLLYALSSTELYRVDPANCAGVSVFKVRQGAQPFNGLTWTPSGQLLATTPNGEVHAIDLKTGEAPLAGTFGDGLNCAGDLVAMPDGTIFATAHDSKAPADVSDLLVKLDPNSFAATRIGPLGYRNVWGLGQWGGKLYGFDGVGDVMLIDPATGQSTQLSTNAQTAFYGGASAPAAP